MYPFKCKIVSFIAISAVLLAFMSLVMFFTYQNMFADEFQIFLDGEKIELKIQPKLENNKIYVPAEPLFRAFGGDYEWSKVEKKITVQTADNMIEMSPGVKLADVNRGNMFKMDAPPKMINNEVMVPIDFICSILGADLDISSDKKTIKMRYFSKMTGSLRIAGATNMMNVSQKVVDIFKKMNPGFNAIVLGVGTSNGIKGTINGEFDVANASRDLTADEAYKNKTLKANKVALEGIAVIVNPNNKIDALNIADVAYLFKGDIVNWKKVYGEDLPVFVNIQEVGSGTLNSFYDMALLAHIKEELAVFTHTAMPHASNGLLRQAVASEKLAIGFVSFPFIDKSVKALRINGVKPTKEDVVNKKWPYINRINIVTKGKISDNAGKYINYLRSPKGRKILEEEGFINVEKYFEFDRLK